MTDFLTNLLARSSGALRTIQPRLPLLYESYPRRGGSLGASKGVELSAGVIVAGAAEWMEPGPARYTLGLKSAAPARPAQSHADVHPRNSGPSFEQAGSVHFELTGMPTARRAVSSTQTGPEALDERSKNNHTFRPAETTAEPISPTSAGSKENPASPESVKVLHPPSARSANEHSRSFPWMQFPPGSLGQPAQRETDSAKKAIPGNFSRARGNQVTSPSLMTPLKVASRAGSLLRSNAEEPAVHISIGRVEVRAISPGSPAQRTPAARSRSTLSLDDYLKRRDRGWQ